ncbi:MAG: hypothetical protein S4CHLAM102_15430 [Chlamydiia bacterium]|nr:hypothetical protein [Chlamydiia bacterium]
MSSIYITFFTLILIGLLCSYIAQSRNRNATVWFIIGFCTGLLGVTILFLLPNRANRQLKAAPVLNSDMADPAPINPEENIEPTPLPEEKVTNEPPKPLDDKTAQELYYYYIDKDSESVGPINFTALKKALQDQIIALTTPIWYEQLNDWATLNDLPELKEILGKE